MSWESECVDTYHFKKWVFELINDLLHAVFVVETSYLRSSPHIPFECQVALFDRCRLCCSAPRPLHVHINTDPRLRLIETYLYRAAKSTSHSLNMKNGAWEGEGRLGERSMIWICMCRLSLHPVCACVCLHVCIGGAAALLDIWMSNDVVPDWAITTSARLLKRGWSDGGRRLVALVPRKWQREQCRKFYINSISLIESIHTQMYVLALGTSRNGALFTSSAVGCVSLKSLKRCGWLFAVV